VIELDLTSKQALVILVLVVCKEGMPQAMSRQSTISREIDLERSQFYTILIISAGIYNEDTVRYFFIPGNIFFYKNIQQGTVQLGIGQPHVGSYIPSGIVETSNLPITIKHGFCNALSSGHGVAV
jgi:hypothetical protein